MRFLQPHSHLFQNPVEAIDLSVHLQLNTLLTSLRENTHFGSHKTSQRILEKTYRIWDCGRLFWRSFKKEGLGSVLDAARKQEQSHNRASWFFFSWEERKQPSPQPEKELCGHFLWFRQYSCFYSLLRHYYGVVIFGLESILSGSGVLWHQTQRPPQPGSENQASK